MRVKASFCRFFTFWNKTWTWEMSPWLWWISISKYSVFNWSICIQVVYMTARCFSWKPCYWIIFDFNQLWFFRLEWSAALWIINIIEYRTRVGSLHSSGEIERRRMDLMSFFSWSIDSFRWPFIKYIIYFCSKFDKNYRCTLWIGAKSWQRTEIQASMRVCVCVVFSPGNKVEFRFNGV